MPQNNTALTRQLIVFLKSPVPGTCKTRLIPLLGAEQACDFYQSLINTCIENIINLKNIDITLYIHPDTSHPFIETLAQHHKLSLHRQTGKNLGERMHNAIQTALQTNHQCVLIGSDCPLLNTAYINQAFKSLNQHDMVLGPAEDGGYVLIGATRIQAELFDNINWGSHTVLQQSLQNNQAASFNTALLNPLWDIDTPEDYFRYQNMNSQPPTAQD